MARWSVVRSIVPVWRAPAWKVVTWTALVCTLWIGASAVATAKIPASAPGPGVPRDIVFSLKHAQGKDWQARDVRIGVSGVSGAGGAEAPSAILTIAQLKLASLQETLRGVRIECPRLDLSDEAFGCRQARVAADWPVIGPQILRARIRYGRADATLDISLDGLRLAQGTAELQGTLRARAWQGGLKMSNVPPATLMQIAGALALPVAGWSAEGEVSLSVEARGSGTRLHTATIDADVSMLSAHNDRGSIASDQLAIRLRSRLQGDDRAANTIHFAAQAESGSGQVYAQPFFLDFGVHALSVQATGSFASGRSLRLDNFSWTHAGVAQAAGEARIAFGAGPPLRSMRLDLAGLRFPEAYESYLQPLLLDTNFKSMQTSGRVEGHLEVEDGVPRKIALTLDELDVGNRLGFGLAGLTGQVNWSMTRPPLAETRREVKAGGAAPPAARQQASHLQWRSGAVFGLEVGGGALAFTAGDRQFHLLRPARIPVLDGAIDLQSFRMRHTGSTGMAFLIDAQIEPMSIAALGRAFGWPEFGGRLSGKVSKLRMRDGVLTLGTILRAQVFDGMVTVADLRLEEPFGQWPRFYSNIALDGLDLESLTRAFSFGRISGRLSGGIDGLQLFNWMPVAFDARLYTPEHDRSRHRISQHAVQNIGRIGGGGAGVTAALSSGVMRFFDDFNYDRLGVSCRLQNDVCTMGGVEDRADGTYYLVKGKGLPRIDVIGSSRRVDWPRLVQQLMAVTQAEGPVVR
ncbi:hypothetical protein [Steroidobacter denitrificans]|nr:hypothetical protein [Steroidobacter denitrificans]